MASHNVSWVPGAHVCFGDPDFIITMERGLVQDPAAVQPLHSTSLDTIIETLEELQLHTWRPMPLEVTSSSTSTMGG